MKIRVFGFFLLLMSQLCFAGTIDKIIIFGDSMSDNGNIFSLTSKFHKVIPKIPVIPKKPPYHEGRFTNGPVWIENLAEALEVPLLDYAYGGSWAEPILDSHQIVPFSLGMQVNMYLVKGIFDRHKDDHLYVIWSGSNDYLQGRSDPEYATSKAVATIEEQLVSLIYHGGKQFLLVSIPDLSGVPEVVERGPQDQAEAKIVTQMHNQKLEAMIKKQQEAHPEVKIVFLNLTIYMQDLLDHPERYNLKNVTDACYTGDFYLNRKMIRNDEIAAAKDQNIDILGNPSLREVYLTSLLAESGQKPCANPDEYLYWDHVHPTRIAHHILSMLAVYKLEDEGLRALR